jgi:hypothetical protein
MTKRSIIEITKIRKAVFTMTKQQKQHVCSALSRMMCVTEMLRHMEIFEENGLVEKNGLVDEVIQLAVENYDCNLGFICDYICNEVENIEK